MVAVVARLEDAQVRIEGDIGDVTEEGIVIPEFDEVLEYVTATIQDGVASDAVRSYLDRMGFDVGAYKPVSQEIDGREPITPEEARQLRLKYAARLEQDVFDGK